MVGPVALLAAAAILIRLVDGDVLGNTITAALRAPHQAAMALAAFGGAFVLRAAVWRRLLPELSSGQAWAGIHVALLGNHLLPLRLGEPLRVASVLRRAGVALGPATASTVALRAADVVALLALAMLLGLPVRGWGAAAWGLSVLGAVLAIGWLGRLRSEHRVHLPGPLVLGGSAAAWLLESVVVWQAAAWAGIALGPSEALLVTVAAVAGQLVALAPAGLGTYEAGAVAGFALVGIEPGAALAVALTAHGLKTVYSLIVGGIALQLPAPGFLGHLRLSRRPGHSEEDMPDPAAPVLLFLPAYDEEASIGAVIDRVPEEVQGRPVQVLVVDDGSCDGTRRVAEGLGVDVISFPANRGLGAAVRAGFRAGVDGRAAAVAFCDSDGEYDPQELDRLVEPILAGRADYVVGSRFAGRIGHMLPHRRWGNRFLTAVLSFIARQPISDGQSGYRALSLSAAAAAEIIHDYNYAQVLTLDLLGKGFRYAEVPITYSFRRSGRSFVRLTTYLRHVMPAVYRELNVN